MVNFKKLTDQAKDLVEKRGGTDALKDDAAQLKEIAKGKGSLADKAKAAAAALKDPGEAGAERAAEPDKPATPKPAAQADPPPQARETAGAAPAEKRDDTPV